MDAQLQVLEELVAAAEDAGIPVWFYGGYGLDALLGRRLRPHKDIDLLLRRGDLAHLVEALLSAGFTVQEQQGHSVGLIKSEQWVECLTFETQADGTLVTDTGDTGVFSWPDGAFPDEPNGVLAGRQVRAASWEAQYLLKAGYQAYDPQQPLRQKDAEDLGLICEHVSAAARERLAELFDPLPGTRKRYPERTEARE